MATITVDLDDVRAHVDRRILSGFTEHLGRCIYGGVFDEGSPLATSAAFEKTCLRPSDGCDHPFCGGREGISSLVTIGPTAWPPRTQGQDGWIWPGTLRSQTVSVPTSLSSFVRGGG